MTARDPELEQFLGVLGKLVQRDPGSASVSNLLDADPQEDRLSDTGVLDLAAETLDMDDALRWLVEVVACAARHDPSVGYALATRYVAQRALARIGDEAAGQAVTATVSEEPLGPDTTITVAHRFAPEMVVVIAANADEMASVRLDPAAPEQTPRRSGLCDALLRDVRVSCTDLESGDSARTTRSEWGLLVAAACVGTAEGALAEAAAYASERRQFGSRLVDFAGLRALLGEMALRVAQARALVNAALDAIGDQESDAPQEGITGHAAEHALVATAGRAAVQVVLDAIQVHGGYGYIEEYPVAGMLRDAISLQARTFPRRLAVAELAGRSS